MGKHHNHNGNHHGTDSCRISRAEKHISTITSDCRRNLRYHQASDAVGVMGGIKINKKGTCGKRAKKNWLPCKGLYKVQNGDDDNRRKQSEKEFCFDIVSLLPEHETESEKIVPVFSLLKIVILRNKL